jgi:UDP-glucose 4-epimerase
MPPMPPMPPNEEKMRAVVTGGAGFIGSHVVESLLSRGHEVVAVDDLSTGRAGNLAGAAGAELVEGSILDAGLLADLVRSADVVFHMAAAVGVRTIVEDPLTSLRTNLRGTENVLDAALGTGARVVVMSTSEIYGDNPADALHEDSPRILGSPLVARWSYAEAKAVDETLAYGYWRAHGLPTVIIRPFNIVGPRQTGRYGMVVPRFVDAALAGEPLLVHGDGTQTRCFCHVDEAVAAVLAIGLHPDAVGQAFNVGNPQEIAIGELARRVVELTGSDSEIRHVPYAQAYPEGFQDMARRVPDIRRARELVGFDPRLGIDDIIRDVAASRTAAAVGVARVH